MIEAVRILKNVTDHRPLITDNYSQYRRGIECFNDGRYFECHEVLEEIWLVAEGEEKAFLHALIQLAAALHHHQRGNHKGARSVYARARRILEALPQQMMQIETAELVRQVGTVLAVADDPAHNSSAEASSRPLIQLVDSQ